MKVEFNNRVDLQRKVLKIVNKKKYKEQLTGLSKAALESWISNNNINEEIVKSKLFSISEKLFFIANKSQDQITEEYIGLQISVKNDIKVLNEILN